MGVRATAQFERHPSRFAAQADWMEKAAQAGLASKGVLYAVIAVLALQVAFGTHRQAADQTGALRAVGTQPGGTVMLVLLALGLAAYALWRLVQAFQDPGEDSPAKNAVLRASYAIRFVIYAGLGALTVRLLMNAGSGGGSERTMTAQVLAWPGGRWIVGGVGLVILAVGLYQGYRGWNSDFLQDLDTRRMSAREYLWVRRIGTAGSLARMVVFALMGIFVLQAALRHDASEARGLDGALQQLAQQRYGPWLLGIVAAGLLCYALLCFVQSRYVRTEAS